MTIQMLTPYSLGRYTIPAGAVVGLFDAATEAGLIAAKQAIASAAAANWAVPVDNPQPASLTGAQVAATQALVSGDGVVAKWTDSSGDFLRRPDQSTVAVNPHLGTFTWAGRPDATLAAAGTRWTCSTYLCDFVRNAAGTAWQLLAPSVLFFDTTAVNATLSASEQILKSYAIPAGLLTTLRWISIQVLASKSGTVDVVTARLRLGVAGTTADAAIMNYGNMTAVNRYLAVDSQQFAVSATSLRLLAASNAVGFNGASSNTAAFIPPASSGVVNMATTNQILTVSLQPAGTSDLATVNHVIITGY